MARNSVNKIILGTLEGGDSYGWTISCFQSS